MIKIMLTTFCNQQCEYCFAQPPRTRHVGPRELDIATLKTFLSQYPAQSVVLSGGEPVLHSRFDLVLKKIKDADKKVGLLTNGGYDPAILAAANMKNVSRVLLNVTSMPLNDTVKQNVRRNIETILNNNIHLTLGVTLYTSGVSLAFLYYLIMNYPVKAVRLSLANPSAGDTNRSIDFPAFLARFSLVFQKVVKQLNHHYIIPTIDCGVPLCIVPEEALRDYKRRTIWDQCCVTQLNLFPDGRLYHCHCSLADNYPLSDMARAQETAALKEEQLRWDVPPMTGCLECEFWWSRRCQGGCLGWRLNAIGQQVKHDHI